VIDALIGIGVDAGAVLTMLANSMMPEALKHGGKLLGC